MVGTRPGLKAFSVIGLLTLFVSACSSGGAPASTGAAPTSGAAAAPTTAAAAAPTTAAAAAPTTAAAAAPTTAAAAAPTKAAAAAPTTAAAAAPTKAAAAAPTTAAAAGGTYPASIKIGLNFPFTGADAADAANIRDGALMAIDEINAKGGIGGKIKIEALVKDDGTVAAGQYDPAQAATNTKQFVADPAVLGIVGPQMSGSGKAMSPIASDADLVIVTPSSTNPDITDPKFAAQYRPKGKAIYFRTVTTDAFQGPNMATYAKEKLNVKSAYVLDDTGAYGEGTANAFEAQAKKIGINVLGHDKLNPKESDYTTILTKIKGLNPDAIYYGGVQQAGVKIAKQMYEVMPKVLKLAGDGMYSTSFPNDAGPAAEGWYATIAAPNSIEEPQAKEWVAKYKSLYKNDPQAYALCSYDAVLVLADAIERIVKDGKTLDRPTMRDYVNQTNLKTMQGTISFDDNGDIKERVVSIFQIQNGAYKYIGIGT